MIATKFAAVATEHKKKTKVDVKKERRTLEKERETRIRGRTLERERRREELAHEQVEYIPSC